LFAFRCLVWLDGHSIMTSSVLIFWHRITDVVRLIKIWASWQYMSACCLCHYWTSPQQLENKQGVRSVIMSRWGGIWWQLPFYYSSLQISTCLLIYQLVSVIGSIMNKDMKLIFYSMH